MKSTEEIKEIIIDLKEKIEYIKGVIKRYPNKDHSKSEVMIKIYSSKKRILEWVLK